MSLPVVPLPRSSVDVAGTPVEIRSLSRSEALELNSIGTDDVQSADAFIIARGCDLTLPEAIAWRETTDTATVGLIVDAVLVLSGLADEPSK